ncbi:unnamed protein product, partial [Musa acuminata var. zebrina]
RGRATLLTGDPESRRRIQAPQSANLQSGLRLHPSKSPNPNNTKRGIEREREEAPRFRASS